jgi:hypothetical protein
MLGHQVDEWRRIAATLQSRPHVPVSRLLAHVSRRWWNQTLRRMPARCGRRSSTRRVTYRCGVPSHSRDRARRCGPRGSSTRCSRSSKLSPSPCDIQLGRLVQGVGRVLTIARKALAAGATRLAARCLRWRRSEVRAASCSRSARSSLRIRSSWVCVDGFA